MLTVVTSTLHLYREALHATSRSLVRGWLAIPAVIVFTLLMLLAHQIARPLGMLGGCMWPLSVVGTTMQRIGHLTPQAWAMDSWNAIINDGAGVAGIGGYLAVLVGFAVVLSLLAVWALGRHARTRR